MYSFPRGDSIDITTSSRRKASKNVILTEASVMAAPAPRVWKDMLQTKTEDFLVRMVKLSQIVSCG
jgi:hypothetical protein